MRNDIGGRPAAELLTTLQAGRALAAIAVVIHHTEIGTDAFVARMLTIHQFLQTDHSAGSPQMACRQV